MINAICGKGGNGLKHYEFTVVAVALSYFLMNWEFLRFCDSCFDRKRRIFQRLWTFALNYSVFVICSVLQLHLILNWTIFFLLLITEIQMIYRRSGLEQICLALGCAMIGLAVNIFFRCIFAVVLNRPLFDVSNEISMTENIKRYPVFLGFILTALSLRVMQNRRLPKRLTALMKDKGSLRFLVRLMLVLYLYLVLNLLTYYTGNDLVMKLWGIKSACFVLLGFALVCSYCLRVSQVRRYEDANHKERQALLQAQQEDARIYVLAYTDTLTGCYNREYAEDMLPKLWDEDQMFCLGFLDLDRLKTVNDQYGHLEGDQYLSFVASAVRELKGEEDILFRYGGDEFLLLQKGSRPPDQSWMDAVNDKLIAYSKASGMPPIMSVSCGFASRNEAQDLEALIYLAEERMYQQKKHHTLRRAHK